MPSETLTRPQRYGATATYTPPEALTEPALEDAIGRASSALGNRQQADGHWVFELEADATIPAEYVLLEHYLDRIDAPLQAKIGIYLRRIQGAHGGWPLFHDGAFNLSASVKAYFALKAIGDAPTRRTWRAPAPPSWPPAGPSAPTSSPASSWRCSARCPGAPCR